ncbi:MAG: glycosyltransferase [Nitrospiraceae bacterium]|nr:MAG: glycosyltransferase [Nitrospiraceae bacterium]
MTNSKKAKLVSIIIRTKNEERFIGQTLSVIYSQTYNNFEVLIIDSGSSDRTIEIAKKYAVTVFEIKPEEFTWGYALNYGFVRAHGEYIICLSAHALPLSDNWLEIIIDNFKDECVAAVMCNTLPWPDCNPFDRRGLLKKFNIRKQDLKVGGPYIFGNVSSAIRKNVWEKIHFDESLTYCEDEEWMRRVKRLNYKVIYEPEAKVYHSHNENLKGIHKRAFSQAYAVTTLKFEEITLWNIFFEVIAGSLYDMLYVLIKFENLKWFLFAPLRRIVIGYAKLKAVLMAK